MLLGIAVFGVLASYLASTFVPSERASARGLEHLVDSVSALHDDVDVIELRSELETVRALLLAGDETQAQE